MPIERVNNLKYKSYDNYSGPDNKAKFNPMKNILFGPNGRGKSSLCKGLLDEYKKIDPNFGLDQSVFYFNRDYIKNNLLIEEESGKGEQIKGVVANFGKTNVDIENRITALETEIINTRQLEEERDEIGKVVYSEIDKIFELKKGTSKIQNYTKKFKMDDKFKDLLLKYQNDYQSVAKIANEKEIKNYKSSGDIEKKKEEAEKINVPHINKINSSVSAEISRIFQKLYNDDAIPKTEIVKWLNEGVTLHEHSDRCLFCGGDINIEDIKKKVDSYTSSKREQDMKRLEKIRDDLKDDLGSIQSFISQKDSVNSKIEGILVSDWKSLKDNCSIIQRFLTNIEKKLNDTNKVIQMGETLLKDTTEQISAILEKIILLKDQQIKKLEKQLDNQNALLKASIGYEVNSNPLIKAKIKEHDDKLKEIASLNKTNDKIEKEINTLQKRKYNTSDFMDDINEILSSLEIDLKLELKDNNYLIKHSSEGVVLTVDDISEGEKNLLSLLYFYCSVFEDKGKTKVKNAIKLIIIDDPISSLDETNRIFILQLIKNICFNARSKTQVFVLTHSWEDFTNLFNTFSKIRDKNNYSYSFWQIAKKDKKSHVFQIKNEANLMTPYEHAFKEIYDTINSGDKDSVLNDGVYHLPNLMRCVLEEFLNFKSANISPSIRYAPEITTILCGDNPSHNDMLSVEHLINVCNIFSHEFPKNPEEIYESAKFLMERIKEVDSNHYHKMIK